MGSPIGAGADSISLPSRACCADAGSTTLWVISHHKDKLIQGLRVSEAVWHVYILECDGRLYTGISVDPARRLAAHRGERKGGAKFTRGADRIEIRYQLPLANRSEALKVEHRIKRLRRAAKLALIEGCPDRAALLSGLRV